MKTQSMEERVSVIFDKWSNNFTGDDLVILDGICNDFKKLISQVKREEREEYHKNLKMIERIKTHSPECVCDSCEYVRLQIAQLKRRTKMSKVKLDIPDWEIDLDHEFAVWFVDSKRHIKLWEKIKGSFHSTLQEYAEGVRKAIRELPPSVIAPLSTPPFRNDLIRKEKVNKALTKLNKQFGVEEGKKRHRTIKQN